VRFLVAGGIEEGEDLYHSALLQLTRDLGVANSVVRVRFLLWCASASVCVRIQHCDSSRAMLAVFKELMEVSFVPELCAVLLWPG
jgi:hypothetical protein